MLRFVSIFLFSFYIFFALAFCQDANTVNATADKDHIETGEIFTYTITIEGKFSDPQLTLPVLKDFIVVAEAQSRNYVTKAGKTIMTLKLEYKLTAAKPGTFVIGPAEVKDRSARIQSGSLQIEVSGRSLQDKQKILPFLENATEI
ncbi:MAG: BatD family protein [Candidatus Omnitrophota bacterium]